MKKTSQKNGTTVGLSSDQLNQAMQELTDIFERAVCQFVLLDETARSIVKDGKVKGKRLDIGVKWNHLTVEVLSTLNSVLTELKLFGDDYFAIAEKSWGTRKFEPVRDKLKGLLFTTPNGTEVKVKILRRDNKCLNNLDNIVYNFDDFLIPNPFDHYYKVRGLLR